MECKITDKNFKEQYEKVIDKLIVLFSISEEQFNYAFQRLPTSLKILLTELYQTNRNNYPGSEDLYDKSLEVFYYFYRIQDNKKEDFTLRNIEHLNDFDIFLDKMLLILELDPEKFVKIFPLCPVIYWDKIDDLRETSFKSHRDSDKFTKCLTKSKKLSFGYEKVGGFNTEEYEDEI
jgi:hypothetical protein